MTLSEREQRLLHEIERALHADDPRLAARLGPPRPRMRTAGRLELLATLIVGLLGASLLVAAALADQTAAAILLTVIGSAVIVAALIGVLISCRSAHRDHRPRRRVRER